MIALRRQARGFTLLEVIVAVVIAALCLSALSQIFMTGMRSARLSDDYTRAVTLAQSMIASAGVEKTLVEGSESGTTADGTLAWTLDVSPEPTDDSDNPIRPPLELKRVIARVAVINGDIGARQTRIELTSLVAVPRTTP